MVRSSNFLCFIIINSPSIEWNPATKDEALDGEHDPFFVYCTSKKLAEEEVWKFADVHPEIEVTASKILFALSTYDC